jgi:tetratricopeptide (TPR) repeat protein
MKRIIFLLMVLTTWVCNAQDLVMSDSALIAMEKADRAFSLIDKDRANIAEAVGLMKEASALCPQNFNYAFQVGFLIFQSGNYAEAVQSLESIMGRRDVTPELYQLLGNTYFLMNDRLKAMNVFDQGLSKFPKSGLLYAEKGKILQDTDVGKALFYFEKGIELNPNYDMNYYYSAMIYLKQAENIKGILHGEIFMLLNKTSIYSVEMSEQLYNAYKKSIRVDASGTASTFFCNTNIPDKTVEMLNSKPMPPLCVAYASMIKQVNIALGAFTISNMSALRTKILDFYFSDKVNEYYQEWSFDFQRYIKDAGHLEAYNHWLLMAGNELEFLQWKENNEEKWTSFTKWFAQHDLSIPE